MRSEVIQTFVGAAREVLAQEMGGPVEPKKVKLQGGPYGTQGVTVLIGLTHDLEGVVILGLTERTALNYVASVIGEPVDELDDLAQSGIGELANIIAGRAGALLSEQGYCTVIAPTVVVVGAGATLSTIGLPRLVVPVETPLGAVELQLAAQDRRSIR